jgi:hypothetical protein
MADDGVCEPRPEGRVEVVRRFRLRDGWPSPRTKPAHTPFAEYREQGGLESYDGGERNEGNEEPRDPERSDEGHGYEQQHCGPTATASAAATTVRPAVVIVRTTASLVDPSPRSSCLKRWTISSE